MPTLVESAGNSSNSVYEMQNEVQLMAAISLAYQQHGGKTDWPKLAEAHCLGGPLQSYATAVGKFVQMYGELRLLHLCFHSIESSKATAPPNCCRSAPDATMAPPFL